MDFSIYILVDIRSMFQSGYGNHQRLAFNICCQMFIEIAEQPIHEFQRKNTLIGTYQCRPVISGPVLGCNLY